MSKSRLSIVTGLVLTVAIALSILASPALSLRNDIPTRLVKKGVKWGYSNAYAAITAYQDARNKMYYYDSIMDRNEADFALAPGAVSAESGTDSATGSAPQPQATSAPAGEIGGAADDSGGSDYSGTNTQVAGIDEGDIVKTNGKYIYQLRTDAGELVILQADGENTKIVSRTNLTDGYNTDDSNKSKWTFEIYISDDRLAVLSSCSEWIAWNDGKGDEDWAVPYYYDYYGGKSWVEMDIYDISNPAKPRILHELGQDGRSIGTRMVDGQVYIVTEHSVYSEADKDKPETFIPALYRSGKAQLPDSGCIIIMPEINSTSYTIISAFSIDDGSLSSNQTVLGGGSTIYMSHNNIFLADSRYEENKTTVRVESVYDVVEYTGETVTSLSRYTVDGGTVRFAATGDIRGSLLNQFSMDEYGGNLRVVTTTDKQSYTTYEDREHGWMNYDWKDNEQTNALYVLDSRLNIIGSLEGLAKDERVYSVRFDGAIGYFVTFRQVDPLFTVDLADPYNPVILSQLKIPGFSQYMHVYGEGRLFGLGQEADPETGRTSGMKLSMFDTSDKSDVSEKHKLLLDSSYSEALYNHKAILISVEKNLIAFPTEIGYSVYSYDDTRGFYAIGQVKIEDGWGYNSRGLYIGEWVYVCSPDRVNIIDMSDFKSVAAIQY